jgi:rhodanese-related sulfurtransferase
VRDDMIVDAAWVHDRLNDNSYAIIDARPPAEFSGATPGDGIDRPGHIPGARNLFWQDLVESADNPRLKDEAELRSLFQAAGAEPGRTVVAYCRTGGQAAFLYTVAHTSATTCGCTMGPSSTGAARSIPWSADALSGCRRRLLGGATATALTSRAPRGRYLASRLRDFPSADNARRRSCCRPDHRSATR